MTSYSCITACNRVPIIAMLSSIYETNKMTSDDASDKRNNDTILSINKNMNIYYTTIKRSDSNG